MFTLVILIALAIIAVNAVRGYKGIDAKPTHICVTCGTQIASAGASRPKWSWLVFPFNLLIAPKRSCPECDGNLIPIQSPRGQQLVQ